MRDVTEGDYEIRYSLGAREWLRTEWPALLVWVVPSVLLLVGLVTAIVFVSPWWALALPLWFVLGGAKAMGLMSFLATGSRILMRVGEHGTIYVGENGSEPVYAHWAGFVDEGSTILLWGAGGRYRLIIPKRALIEADYAALRIRVGVDLARLRPGAELRIR